MIEYNYSDYDHQAKLIKEKFSRINYVRKQIGDLPLDTSPALKMLFKRILRHNGLDNKYLGNGKKREIK